MAIGRNNKNGTWYFVLELGKDESGKRKQKRKQGFKTKKEVVTALLEEKALLNKEIN
ncbi:Arm DNA-binding domain-containing protein [Neobacillus niacini]|uniref:Arm DNA-binding domain-containing protein n=1 Tax=Neobacillus niacini TaxID=86668 RepID=UPI0039839053